MPLARPETFTGNHQYAARNTQDDMSWHEAHLGQSWGNICCDKTSKLPPMNMLEDHSTDNRKKSYSPIVQSRITYRKKVVIVVFVFLFFCLPLFTSE
jgi:hypothetical protein